MARPVRTTVDQGHVRRHNLSVVLSRLADGSRLSRADIAGLTGLTRATASSLAAELIQRGLVREVGTGTTVKVGRPATLLELDGSDVVSVGITIDVGYLHTLGRDLAGNIVYSRRSAIVSDAIPVDLGVTLLREEIDAVTAAMEGEGRSVIGVTVAVPGITDIERGVVVLTPNLGWRNVPLVALLASGSDGFPIEIDNEANLAALAEARAGSAAGERNMVYLLSMNGVGGGAIVDGHLVRGATGVGAEFGHISVQPRGSMCVCGNRGCLETVVGVKALLHAALPAEAAALAADSTISPDSKVARVVDRAVRNDPSTIAGLQKFGTALGRGLGVLIGAFDPGVIVLGGWLPEVYPWMGAEVAAAVRSSSLAVATCRIVPSTLGYTSTALGGAIHSAERVFDDPTVVGDADR